MKTIRELSEDVYEQLGSVKEIGQKNITAIVTFVFSRIIDEMLLNRTFTVGNFGTFTPSSKGNIKFFPNISLRLLIKSRYDEILRLIKEKNRW